MSNSGAIYSFKRISKVLIDVFLIALSLVISYKLRIDYHLSSGFQNWYWTSQLPFILPVVVALRISLLFAF